MRPRSNPAAVPATRQGQGLGEKSASDQSFGAAQGPNEANLGPASDNRNGNCVVDQESTNDQRDVTQHVQVPAEGGQHFPILICSRAGGVHFD